MPNSVNPQSNSLHFQSHTQLTTLSCTTHNMLTTYPCLTTALASCLDSSRQFESCCGSDRTSCRPSPLSLLSGISTATFYHYIHTYYILYLISGRLTLHWCQKGLPSSCPYLFSYTSSFLPFLCSDFFLSLVLGLFQDPGLDLDLVLILSLLYLVLLFRRLL